MIWHILSYFFTKSLKYQAVVDSKINRIVRTTIHKLWTVNTNKQTTALLHICQVSRILRVKPGFLYFHLHWKFPPAYTRILLASPAIARILFDGNKIAQANIFAERKEKN